MSLQVLSPHRRAAPPFDIHAATELLAQQLANTAVDRDRQGGHASHERELIRASGLLALTVPRNLGGLGVDCVALLRVVRRLAQDDSALAHVFGYHHLQVASVLLFGSAEQQQRLLYPTVRERWFWGNAVNSLDTRLVATPVRGDWQLDGTKCYASGSLGADRLVLSAHVAAGDGSEPLLLIGTLDARAPGVQVQGDWDAFGQRQTDSGQVSFRAVRLPAHDVLLPPGAVRTPRQSLRQLLSQLTLANLYTGIAFGALAAARQWTVQRTRAWPASGFERPADDPVVQHRYGQLRLLARSAELACDAAGERLLAAWQRGLALKAAERGEVAIAVAEAKVLSHRASVEVSSQLFELTGASSTSARFGLDRFWRNARVHTLHDPVDLKLRDIGRHALEGRWPEPTPYS